MRLPFLQVIQACFVLCMVVSIPSTCSAASAIRPNILFILVDQWRAQSFGYTGDANVRTPNLDRLERDSVHFTQAVAGMPVCSPTRASLLTGQRPLRHGVFMNDVPLSTNAVTLPKVLKASGYDTACIGKWHIDGHGRSSYIPAERRQGFDYWKVLECTHEYNNSYYYADGPEKLKWEGYDAFAQTRDARQYLSSRSKDSKPFLLWLAFGPPHNPYETAPKRYRDMYDPEKLTLRQNVPANLASIARKELAGYYAHCTALDDCIQELLETLESKGLKDNTIVVFTSDHGDMLRSQGLQRKQKPFEESACVPMLFHIPAALRLGIKPGRVTGAMNTEDVMPTLLALCGLRPPPTVEGNSFLNHMKGGKDPSGGASILSCVAPFGEFNRTQGGREYRAIRTQEYTYARDLSGPWLLYNHQNDPFQTVNLIGKPEYQSVQKHLDRQLMNRLKENSDRFLPATNYISQWGYTVDASGTVPYRN